MQFFEMRGVENSTMELIYLSIHLLVQRFGKKGVRPYEIGITTDR